MRSLGEIGRNYSLSNEMMSMKSVILYFQHTR